jgi:hypothetical protein
MGFPDRFYRLLRLYVNVCLYMLRFEHKFIYLQFYISLGERVPKRRGKRKICKPGDHIHILVTKDFADTATDFFRICKDEHYNPSELIRSLISDWVIRQHELKKMLKEKDITKSEFMKEMATAYEEAILYRR